jgi:hypothetical protein
MIINRSVVFVLPLMIIIFRSGTMKKIFRSLYCRSIGLSPHSSIFVTFVVPVHILLYVWAVQLSLFLSKKKKSLIVL